MKELLTLALRNIGVLDKVNEFLKMQCSIFDVYNVSEFVFPPREEVEAP